MSLSKKRHDFDTLPRSEYINKYHMEFITDDVWKCLRIDYSRLEDFLFNKNTDAIISCRVEKSQVSNFYAECLTYSKFSKNLLILFSGLKCIGFFDYYGISFAKWIKMKDFLNPGSDDYPNELTIEEAVRHPYGEKYLLMRFKSLRFISMPGL